LPQLTGWHSSLVHHHHHQHRVLLRTTYS
jgi:hypothetical protein